MLYLAGAGALLLGLVLFVPFRLELSGRYREELSATVRLTWLRGLIKVRYLVRERELHLSPGAFSVRRGARPAGAHPATRPRRRERKFDASHLPAILKLLPRVYRSLSPRGEIRAEFGTGDPAETGVILGLLSAVVAALPLPVLLVPDFQNRAFALAGELRVRILVAGLLAILLRVALAVGAGRSWFAHRERRRTWNTLGS